MTVINAKEYILSVLFYEGKFEIPWHQRYYDWGKENVTELLEDLLEAFHEKRECYFLGTVVLVDKLGAVKEINDGQQRMVTFSLICAQFARIFERINDSRRESLALRVLFDLDQNHTSRLSESDEFTPRLIPPRDYKSPYNLLIRGKNIGTNGKLMVAWGEIEKYFLPIEINETRHFFDFLMNKLEISCLHIPERIDPNSVYETLNARGKSPGNLDLIRNHFYSFFNQEKESRRDTVHENLESIREKLSELKSTEYIRCYLQCEYGFLPEKRFYRATKANIQNKCDGLQSSKVADYVFHLIEGISQDEKIEIFRLISSPSENDPLIEQFLRDSRTTASRRNLYTFLSELQKYKVVQPIIFALLNFYVQKNEREERKNISRFVHGALKLLNAFVMRTTFVASKFEPYYFESDFSYLAKKITFARSINGASFRKTLKDKDKYGVFKDLEFIERISNIKMRNQGKAKQFFVGLNSCEQSHGSRIDEKKYTVEHILPESQSHLKGWGNFTQLQHEDNVNRLGNLTLLSQARNKSGDSYNRSFDKKKMIYQDSEVLLTQDIVEIDDWSPAEIAKRQKRLARRATRVWDLTDTT